MFDQAYSDSCHEVNRDLQLLFTDVVIPDASGPFKMGHTTDGGSTKEYFKVSKGTSDSIQQEATTRRETTWPDGTIRLELPEGLGYTRQP